MKIGRISIPSSLPWSVGVAFALALLVGCGGSSGGATGSGTTGPITVSLSDPPVCKGLGSPSGLPFDEVWVTVTLVRAHISGSAGDNDGGWVDLVDLRDNPMQINLLGGSGTQCTLATLGLTSALPAGNYQQIRLHLLSNNPGAGEATPSPNACAGATQGGFNCALPSGGTMTTLQLSSEAQTGIKIPPGQIAGGALSLAEGEAADINIEFDACNSIVAESNGQLRLKPTLHAGEVSLTTETLSGTVVDMATGDPIPNATVVVLIEQPDADGIDRVFMQTLADPTDGTFTVCPLPPGDYDVVVAATNGSTTYNATVTFGVPAGTNLGTIPLAPENPGDMPGGITGTVTSSDANGPVEVDVALSALQEVDKNGTPVLVTIPLFGNSTPTLATEDTGACPSVNVACGTYSLFVPSSNPKTGTFDAAGTTYTDPAAPPVLYKVNAQAFIIGSGGLSNCAEQPSITVELDDAGNPLEVTPGGSTTAAQIDFTGCTP